MTVKASSPRAKVLFAIPSMALGGSERILLNLLRHMDRARFEPHVAVMNPGEVWLDNAPNDVYVHELGIRRARCAIVPFAELCWKIRPGAILSTSAHLNSAIVAARPLLPMPVKVLTREGAHVTSPEATPSRLRLLIYKHVYRRADMVICQSDFMREDLIRHFGISRSRTVRIYNPVDVDNIEALAHSEPNPLSQEEGPNVVAVGRLSFEKGFDLLLRCIPSVRRSLPAVRLTVVGEGPEFQALIAARRELALESCVRFVGLRRNPYPFMKHADVVVLPSRCEALPNVVLEAVGLGTRVVTTNCTGALGEITSCTDLVTVTKTMSPEALAAAIIAALTDTNPRRTADRGADFHARFDARVVTREYERILWQSVNARAGHCGANAAGRA